MAGKKKRNKYQRKISYNRGNVQNRFGMFLAILVVVTLVGIISVISIRLSAELEAKEKRKAQLQEQIEREIEYSRELDQKEKEVQTDQYKEKTAREKLGLVKDGEIVFENRGSK